MSEPDVIFVSYDEPNADENFARLLTFAPHAKRLHGVKGIYNAYQAAADMSEAPYFYMVDGDSWVLDGMTFGMAGQVPAEIYTWRSVNAVNGLVSRTGAVKLMSCRVVRMRPGAADFFGSMTGRRRIIHVAASENRFNASPFLAWRDAYRECAKLAAASVSDPSGQKLQVWQTRGGDKPFGAWSLIGARMGAELGRRDSGAALGLINDHEFLHETFSRLNGAAGSPGDAP